VRDIISKRETHFVRLGFQTSTARRFDKSRTKVKTEAMGSDKKRGIFFFCTSVKLQNLEREFGRC
jgi:hypothetical protein